MRIGLREPLRDGALRRRPGRDLVDQPLDVRELVERAFAQHERDQARPAPQRHVDDGVGLAQHVAPLRQALVEDAVVPLDLDQPLLRWSSITQIIYNLALGAAAVNSF